MLKFIVILLIEIIQANLYNPHVYPMVGPFFEGWYCRLTSKDSNKSYGFLFGKVLAKEQKYPLQYLSVLRSEGNGKPMESYDVFPKTYQITADGQDVTQNPVQGGYANFEFQSEFGWFKVENDEVSWHFKFLNIEFQGEGKNHKFWLPDGQGPAQWTDKLPLPLHWFVYSTGTEITSFRFKNQVYSEYGTGELHMEKNWGKSFPSAWIWAQSTNQNSTFIMAGGPLPGPLPIESHLIGYKNPALNIQINFGPQNSVCSSTQGNQDYNCKGQLEVSAWNPLNKIEAKFISNPKIFDTCLLGPTEFGFKGLCAESYQTDVSIQVYKMTLTGWKLIDQQLYQNAALEFGGDYICKSFNPCEL